MRPYGSPETLERRRRRAAALFAHGLRVSEVARQLGVSASTASVWRKAYLQHGVAGLAPKPVPGRPKKLALKHRKRLWEILLAGALAYGFPNDLWTLKRIAAVIQREFGVRYHPGHLWKILRGAGWSCQVPERRAIQRNEEAIVHWKRYTWPHIKKGPRAWRPPRLPR
ncbi:MAG: IS630 family transposase [Candidatus Brocadiia bacterium]